MDANRLRFHLLADRLHWEPASEADAPKLRYDEERRALRLASALGDPTWTETTSAAEVSALLARVPGAVDSFGTWASLNTSTGEVLAAGAGPQPVPLFIPGTHGPVGTPTDMALGHEGILYVAIAGKVVLVDLLDRWDPVTVSAPGFSAWRLSALPEGGVLAMSSSGASVGLARVRGRPLPRFVASQPYTGTTFRPEEENPDPPRMEVLAPALSFAGEVLVALAVSPEGKVALLSHVSDAAAAGVPGDEAWARLRLFGASGAGQPMALEHVRRPYSLTWLSSQRLAVLVKEQDKSTSVVVPYLTGSGGDTLVPQGDYYPLHGHDGGPFLHGTTLPPHYPVAGGAPTPLYPVSLPCFAPRAEARNALAGAGLVDSGEPNATWHRLYLEACLPARCGVRVLLAATNTPERPASNAPGAWHEHLFGSVEPEGDPREVPRGTWVPTPSELPFHPGLVPGTPEPGRRGLFTALVQRPGHRVRALRGRYLWVRVELLGDGRATPEVFALRAYASRFSYPERYLPELYRESLFGEEADRPGPATPADFLERLLGLAEGFLTPLEDRIAHSFLLTDARTVPEESLEWLASWVGLTFDPLLPRERRRRMLQAAAWIRPWRGTLRGLALALDAATEGLVSRGGIVLVEDFRLRRTFATLLGVDLAEEDDPLLPGLYSSGNSYVGDSLLLGSEHNKELLALFGEELPTTAAEEQAVERFFERLAHRVTVLVHQQADRELLGLVRRIATLEAPAHVAMTVTTATTPFMVGVASLVGVDSWLGTPQAVFQPVRVGQSALGVRNVLGRPPSLDPRLPAGG